MSRAEQEGRSIRLVVESVPPLLFRTGGQIGLVNKQPKMCRRLYLDASGRVVRRERNARDPLEIVRQAVVNPEKTKIRHRRLRIALPEMHSMWKNTRYLQVPLEVREAHNHRRRDIAALNVAAFEEVASALDEAENALCDMDCSDDAIL